MENNSCLLSIILPAYNEGSRIDASLKAVMAKMSSLNIPYELIVVDDGSTDDTFQRARPFAGEHVHVLTYDQNRGKGYAIRHGMLKAQGAYKLFMDVDLATSLEAVEEFLQIMREKPVDIIIGNRKNNPSLQEVKQPLYRQFFGEGFTRLSCLVVGCEFSDFTCGFKMYTRRAADIIFPRQRTFDWAFDTELVAIAVQHNLKIYESPVQWHHCQGSKVRVTRDITRSLISLGKIGFNSIRGLYKRAAAVEALKPSHESA